MRLVLVLQVTGRRVGEVCQLPFDCLLQDSQGDWFLSHYQSREELLNLNCHVGKGKRRYDGILVENSLLLICFLSRVSQDKDTTIFHVDDPVIGVAIPPGTSFRLA